ncbi:MAG: ATPase [Haloplasmataceae bacterium]|jgi:hypothetical protein|nr:ATPase [Haloplasmataceae bacterium]
MYIIGAGSLLGVAISNENISFPVGKVQTIKMFPMNFEEFLIANNKQVLIDVIRKSYLSSNKLDNPLHEDALNMYQTYMVLGGMPEVVKTYIETGSFVQSVTIIDEIYENYLYDMNKYTSKSEVLKVKACYQSITKQLQKENKNFKYNVVMNGKNKQYFGSSLLWLTNASIAYESKLLNNCNLPLAYHTDEFIFRMYLSDLGLFSKMTHTPINDLLNPLYRDDISGI